MLPMRNIHVTASEEEAVRVSTSNAEARSTYVSNTTAPMRNIHATASEEGCPREHFMQRLPQSGAN
eukprot:11377657-Alexandrium_andersonii.AAC.1